MARTHSSPEQRELDMKAMLDVALTMPGSTGNNFNRLYSYSRLNQTLLYMQGVEPQPVATFNRWKEVGRHVVKGAKAKEIIRPITVTLKDREDDDGNPIRLTRFKLVKAIFALSDTDGEPLPPAETPEWSLDQAMSTMNVTRVPYRSFEGNAHGYSKGRELAISELATDSLATAIHELAHIELGHTTPQGLTEYQSHRGRMEFAAEGTSYLVLNELEELTDQRASESRSYIQSWLQGERPSDAAIREVFKATDVILKAGQVALHGAEVSDVA